tara:strand:+ start:5463 stop:8744 length:3282 start_codon:yes stop_codon:yes gene_type:complete
MKHKTYIPLHGHSTYSQGDGVARISDIVERTKEIGANAVGLSEHGNMSSFFKFYKECIENDVKPIIGCELYLNDLYYSDNEQFLEIRQKEKDKTKKAIADNYHQIAYCKNYKGVQNLIHLTNIGFENFYRKPLVSTELLFEKLDNNNIVTTGCLQSVFNRLIVSGKENEALALIKKFYDKFGEDFYLEIIINQLDEQKKCNNFYKKVYEKTGIKPVFATDYHYVDKNDWFIQYLLYVIKGRKSVREYPDSDWFYDVRDLYIKTADEVYALAQKYQVDEDFLNIAIKSTFEIRDKVDIELPLYPDNFPKFNEIEEYSKNQFLEKLNKKWDEKVENELIPSDKLEEYKERLKYEMKVINDKGFIDYFLILDDLLNNFVYKCGGATGAGRGSAPGSLVLFVLDITKIDPIKHSLIFDRFMNPARIDPADIDLDIDSKTQKEAENYLKEKYGKNKVCHIANFGKFGAKTAIKDLCRIFELDFNLSNRLTSYFNDLKSVVQIEGELHKAETIASKKNEIDLLKFIEENRSLFTNVGNKFVGMVRQTGRHASGILLSNKTLDRSDIPLLKLKGELVTGVQEGGDEREVAELGYCKLDILGLKAVSVINDTIRLIEDNYDVKSIEQNILKSDLNDQKVYEEFQSGNCRDIFQFGSDSMISLLKQIKPTNINDLSVVNALFRPAVIQAQGIEAYLKNKRNPEEAKERLDNVHSKLWKITKESFGVPIFQEQIMFILQELGGFTLAEADKSRKILKLLHKGNQEKNKDFYNMMDKFKKQARKNGISKEHIAWLFDILGKYSEYSFCKAHSLSYAMNAYISMWLKIYYPKEYFSSLFNHSTSSDLSWFIKQVKRQGTKINEFKSGKTDDKFSVDYSNNCITFGLNKIKGMQRKDVSIVNKVEADNVYDLVEYLIENKISKRTIEPLCRLRYFNEIFDNSKQLEIIFAKVKSKKKNESIKEKIDFIINDNGAIEDWTKQEYIKFEKKYFDFYFDEHPFVIRYDKIREETPYLINQISSPKQLQDKKKGGVILCGVINDIILKKAKKTGREYYKLIIEDDEKQLYVTVFNSRDIVPLEIGDFIVMKASKSKFGFTKAKQSEIKIM